MMAIIIMKKISENNNVLLVHTKIFSICNFREVTKWAFCICFSILLFAAIEQDF